MEELKGPVNYCTTQQLTIRHLSHQCLQCYIVHSEMLFVSPQL